MRERNATAACATWLAYGVRNHLPINNVLRPEASVICSSYYEA